MEPLTTTEEKKSFILLNAVIFHYHGLDENEESILRKMASEYNADTELQWALEFISKDYITAFDRARKYLHESVSNFEKVKRLKFLDAAWKANYSKGYITEMEATAILKLAKDWSVDEALIELVQQ